MTRQNGLDLVKVKIDGFEYGELKNYASTLYNYRTATVYSCPEVLKQPKKYLKPQKPMDVYSFGLIMWQLYHEKVPFDGNLVSCTECVLQDTRPKI